MFNFMHLTCKSVYALKIYTLIMLENIQKMFLDAVSALNSLQTNASVLQQSKKRIGQPNTNVEDTRKYLQRSGISQDTLDSCLSAIHVAGTKGKGSTCAFTESILRHHGLKTGFYSSPHLVAVRERIRINGKPLSMEKFTHYFWDVYNNLALKKECDSDMPPYFKFLTVMAFNVFIKEKVDVALIEVGIGGELDCTNVIRKPVVVGITSLGLDHTTLLGNTVELIAWQKAGILKEGVPAFTVHNQPGDSLNVIRQRAEKIKCPLYLAPAFEDYKWPNGEKPVLGLDSNVQKLNASIAIQLAHTWLKIKNGLPYEKRTLAIPELTAKGLLNVSWPGRAQTLIQSPQLKIFLDGAHTTESIENCLAWFQVASEKQTSSGNVTKVLIFNSTGERDPSNLLRPLSNAKVFSKVIFCPNIVSSKENQKTDQSNFMVTEEQQLKRACAHLTAWNLLKDESDEKCDTQAFHCINDALAFVQNLSTLSEVHVLVTGSLHLVGCVLGKLEETIVEEEIDTNQEVAKLQQL
ncbi:folylpolyglutamate synthase, mitochondrial-like isoform X2 [Neocloeon triangulifer]|uniref:folylpolyglutamate synthase, mitochondrial-like isoform X2 n=1 Tax=Neocloeon triangulifer TaxID=2078957 RepID=UPI00286ED65A|nr:folylpolyglutamate synthase, mitochondrial-like isoform X2 [Neocloeon triangulifer]